MPKILRARVAQDEQEERQIRKLAASLHGPADWISHACMVVLSWDGKRVQTIAKEVQCSAQTMRRRLNRFDAEGIEGLGDRPRSGRPSRLTEGERSKLIAPVKQALPGRLERQADELVACEEEGSGKFRLNALAQAAKEAGIRVKRSQIRTILLREGVGFRQTYSWGTSHDPDFDRNPNRGRLPLHSAARGLDDGSRTDELGPVVPRSFPPAPGWSADGHRSKAPLDYSSGEEKVWIYGALRVRSSMRRVSRRPSSTGEPPPGSGDALAIRSSSFSACLLLPDLTNRAVEAVREVRQQVSVCR
jgi:transposase